MANRNFKLASVKTDMGFCENCETHFNRGAVVLYRYRPNSIQSFDMFCDEICLSDWRERHDKSINSMLNKMSVQFN